MELLGNDDCSDSSDDVGSPLDSSQISTSTTSKKRLYSDVWNYFTVYNNKGTCKCGSVFTYKEDGTTGTSSLNRHLRTCTVKNANTKQACIVYDSYANSLINASIQFNQVRSMKSLVELIVGHEMPFCFVESSGLDVFLKGLNPSFKLCSRQQCRGV